MKNLTKRVVAFFTSLLLIIILTSFSLAMAGITKEKAEYYRKLIFAIQREGMVSDFQKKFGLPVTGKVDEATIAKIDWLFYQGELKIMNSNGNISIKQEEINNVDNKQSANNASSSKYWYSDFQSLKHLVYWLLSILLLLACIYWLLGFLNRKGKEKVKSLSREKTLYKNQQPTSSNYPAADAYEGVVRQKDSSQKSGNFSKEINFSLIQGDSYRHFRVKFVGNDKNNVSCPTRSWTGIYPFEYAKEIVISDMKYFLNNKDTSGNPDYYDGIEQDAGNVKKQTNGARITDIISRRLKQRTTNIAEWEINKEQCPFELPMNDLSAKNFIVQLEKIKDKEDQFIDPFYDGILTHEDVIERLKEALCLYLSEIEEVRKTFNPERAKRLKELFDKGELVEAPSS